MYIAETYLIIGKRAWLRDQVMWDCRDLKIQFMITANTLGFLESGEKYLVGDGVGTLSLRTSEKETLDPMCAKPTIECYVIRRPKDAKLQLDPSFKTRQMDERPGLMLTAMSTTLKSGVFLGQNVTMPDTGYIPLPQAEQLITYRCIVGCLVWLIGRRRHTRRFTWHADVETDFVKLYSDDAAATDSFDVDDDVEQKNNSVRDGGEGKALVLAYEN
ncbi:hypothetical protein BJ138DRAFT_1104186 [Hygrophoropsis aurantiaca]|uniref:Uncharacterized protein n=1 Tax=Hygrophoropsis aurantiaca TaxID=72124 RepID=A0ACB8A2G7_9AGAM|nr:hypothetical protein BJ138DRAFT_1104186 [Hygrophoropsis aurantiaca]